MHLLILLIPLCVLTNNGDYFNVRWSGLIAVSGVAIYFWLKERSNWWAPLIVPYLFISCAWTLYDGNQYMSVAHLTRSSLQTFSMNYLMGALCVGIMVFICRKRWKESMAIIGFADSLYVMFERFYLMKEPYFCGGFIGNASLNACFIAATIPLMMSFLTARLTIIMLGITCLSVLLSGSSMGIAALLFMGVYSLYAHIGFTRKLFVYSAFIVIGLFMLGMTVAGDKFLSTSNRADMWQFFFGHWWNMNWKFNLFGTGVGTFPVFSSDWQQYFKVALPAWWTWMHNDLLDLLFEGGIVGALLSLLSWLYLYLRSKSMDIYFHTSFATFSFISLGNYPFHIPLTALLGGYLIVECLKIKSKTSKSLTKTKNYSAEEGFSP